MKKTADIYIDGTYLAHNPTWDAADAPFKADTILSLLQNNGVRSDTVCEVGCGSGEILKFLSSKLPQTKFFGFDISGDAIAIAKQKENERLRFEQQDFAETPATAVYDVLLVIDVVEHVENYFKFLRDIAYKGRYTIFHIPLDMCVWTLFREQMLLESKERVGHIHNFTEDFVKSILTDCGYKILAQLYTEPTFTEKSFKQSLVNSVRRLLFKLSKRLSSKLLGGYSIMLLTENPRI